MTLSSLTTPEASEEDVEKNGAHTSNGDLFLSYNSHENISSQKTSFASNNSILVSSPPFFTQTGVLGSGGHSERRDIISYKVKEGDSIGSIAEKLDISKETIEWANDIKGGSVKAGDELLILPVTGVLYYVQRGDSPSEIAQKHKTGLQGIVDFNEIEESNIRPGDMLIIPDGEKPPEPPAPRRQPRVPAASGFASVTRGTITQGDHPGHRNAMDIANACGTPIYATSSGTVERIGYNNWPAGNFVRINHGNFSALYAHLQTIGVSPGDRVGSGQYIGTMGTTGYSTGCHLHFETRGRTNPFSYMRRGDVMR